jgi:molecular chaperone GrpE
MTDVVMPRLSDSMEEGTILQWLKSVGDEIAVGDELVEIETDKANMAYESDTAGTLTEILAEEGATLPIGTPIARIGDPAEGSDASTAGPVGAGDPPPPPVAKASSGEVPPTPPPAGGDPAEDVQGRGAGSPTPDPGAGGATGAEVEADIEQLLADTQRERDEYLDLAKRTKADFENFRKRMGAEVLASTARGKAEVLGGVIPVLDDLERAIQAAGLDPEGDSEDGLAHGVLLVFRSLRDALARNGVEAVDPTGEKFDPMQHEALSTQTAEGVDSGVVVETMQKGYRLGEQLVRPARVVVAE